MKTILKLFILFSTLHPAYAADVKNSQMTIENKDLVITKSAFRDRLMFTCKVTGTDLEPFIFNSNTKKLTHPLIFIDGKRHSVNTKFNLLKITDEYLLLGRTYKGKKHGITGNVKEHIYVLRYASKIGAQYTVKAKSRIFVNNEELSGNDGRCDVTTRLF
ncbi:MAG: hypothetical protein OQK69_09250 [Gammaproteobacteria bacterium]|nr:hypothetical protein [Gammaproteobacteria bacterium]